jgi:hypothetical protein
LLIPAAEILASLAVWHGTPTDWAGEPPHFWLLEGLRLEYWCGFGLLFASIWSVVRIGFRRQMATLALAIVGAGCSLATEILTSIYFWEKLPSNQVGYLGWPSHQRYVVEHLTSWAIIILLGLAVMYIWDRHRKSQSKVAGTVAGR